MSVPGTLALNQVIVETRKNLLLKFVNTDTILIRPINQVFGRSNVPPSGDLRVASLPQIARKPLQQGSTSTIAKRVNSLLRFKIIVKHDILLNRPNWPRKTVRLCGDKSLRNEAEAGSPK